MGRSQGTHVLDGNLHIFHVSCLSHPNRADAPTIEICSEGLVTVDCQDHLFAWTGQDSEVLPGPRLLPAECVRHNADQRQGNQHDKYEPSKVA